MRCAFGIAVCCPRCTAAYVEREFYGIGQTEAVTNVNGRTGCSIAFEQLQCVWWVWVWGVGAVHCIVVQRHSKLQERMVVQCVR